MNGISIVYYINIVIFLYITFHDTNRCNAALQKKLSFYNKCIVCQGQ